MFLRRIVCNVLFNVFIWMKMKRRWMTNTLSIIIPKFAGDENKRWRMLFIVLFCSILIFIIASHGKREILILKWMKLFFFTFITLYNNSCIFEWGYPFPQFSSKHYFACIYLPFLLYTHIKQFPQFNSPCFLLCPLIWWRDIRSKC